MLIWPAGLLRLVGPDEDGDLRPVGQYARVGIHRLDVGGLHAEELGHVERGRLAAGLVEDLGDRALLVGAVVRNDALAVALARDLVGRAASQAGDRGPVEDRDRERSAIDLRRGLLRR